MSDKTLCKSCDGAGTVPTGIEESPEASCRRCNGDGYEPASSPAMNAASPEPDPVKMVMGAVKSTQQRLAEKSAQPVGNMTGEFPARNAASPISPTDTLLALRYEHVAGFQCGATHVEFAEGCEHGYGIFHDGTQGQVAYTRGEAEHYVLDGKWRKVTAPVGQAMNAASPTEAPAMNGIKATLRHDEGAIARCSYCRRYSLDPATLSDRQPVCDCGKANGWSGSFVRPDADSIWSGKVPSAAPVDQGSSPEHDLLNQRWSKEADMIESWKGKGSATRGGGSPTVSTFGAMDISDLDQARGVITRLRQRLYDIAQEQPRAALAASAEQSNNSGSALDEYGETDFGFTFAGVQLEAGDKRLASLIVRALGTAHPAMDDLTALLFRARPASVAERAAAPASVPEGYVLALQAVVEMPDGTKELGYTLLSGVGVFQTRAEVSATIAELSLPLGWVSMTTRQLLPGWMLPAAPDAAPASASEVTDDAAALAEEVARLQDALCFWLPSITDREDEVADRILQDAFLLVGCDGNMPEDFKTAQELGWVALSAAPDVALPAAPSNNSPVGAKEKE